MKQILILFFLCSQYMHGSQSLDKYFSYLEQLARSNGKYGEGEIEIVIDPEEIFRIQKIQEGRLLKKGFSFDEAVEFSRIGIVNEDQYWVWIRDAVYFPQGIPGTYDRLLWKSELNAQRVGVAVLPLLPSGRIALVLNYRHATRSWEFELPRGRIEYQETPEEAAFRELKEETGFLVSSVDFLGDIATDTGMLSAVIPVFLGKISAQEESSPEYSEVIHSVISFTKDELKEGLVRGFLDVSLDGIKKQIPLRDAFLTFALFQAECRKFL